MNVSFSLVENKNANESFLKLLIFVIFPRIECDFDPKNKKAYLLMVLI